MAAVHTEAAAIFAGNMVNEAEDSIKFIPFRPVGVYDSKSPVTFTIPGNSSQYVSLRDSYLLVQCHTEETDSTGKPKAEEKRQGGQSDVKTYEEILEMQNEAERRYARYEAAKKNLEEFRGTDETERTNLVRTSESLKDFAMRAMEGYITEKHKHRQVEGLDGSIIPIDNVIHSMWNGVDVMMNHKLVSTTNQKYMYKAYIETQLNNSASTKKYQLESQGFFGDGKQKDADFNVSFNSGMEKRYNTFKDGRRALLMGYLLSDIMGIQASIVNGVEISITLHPNPEAVRVHCLGNKEYGAVVIDDITLMVCKRQMSKEVLLAHADIMENCPATYPFKKSEVRAYNGHKGQSQITIENPYESQIPTRLIVAMVDAAAHMGNFKMTPLNFQHFNLRDASFKIDNESVAKPPYKIDIGSNKVIEPLMELYSILGKIGEDRDIGITVDEFKDGTFMLPFDVTPTSSANMEYLSKKEGGNCTLELQFHEPLPKDIIILTYAIFPAELRIDGARNCSVEMI